jgi:hypothetical protein
MHLRASRKTGAGGTHRGGARAGRLEPLHSSDRRATGSPLPGLRSQPARLRQEQESSPRPRRGWALSDALSGWVGAVGSFRASQAIANPARTTDLPFPRSATIAGYRVRAGAKPGSFRVESPLITHLGFLRARCLRLRSRRCGHLCFEHTNRRRR